MDKLNISPDFTIDDIHKVREYNYEATKNMTDKEKRTYYDLKADKVRQELARLRDSKMLKS